MCLQPAVYKLHSGLPLATREGHISVFGLINLRTPMEVSLDLGLANEPRYMNNNAAYRNAAVREFTPISIRPISMPQGD